MKQTGSVTPIIFIVLLIIIAVFSFLFLIRPFKIPDNAVKLFKGGEIVLAEKVSYMFSQPQIGDRVLFIPKDRGDMEYVGIIKDITEEENIKTFSIVSTGTGQPWLVTKDKIVWKVYLPAVSREEILANLPSPSPSSTDNSQESTTSAEAANWKIYTDTKYNYTIGYPSHWKLQQTPSGGVSIQSADWMERTNISTSKGALVIVWPDHNPPSTPSTSSGGSDFFVHSQDKINLGNLDATLYEVSGAGIEGYGNSVAIKKIKKKESDYFDYLTIDFYYEQNRKEELKNIFDQILSTFKFTN